jgi:sugar/nucleoside kinase (ribokinase family)
LSRFQRVLQSDRRLREMPQVVVLGDVNVDVIAHYPRFPVQGRDAFATAAEFHCGGAAANTAIALAGLGVEPLLIARVGRDPWAAIALRSLKEAGVDLGGLQRDGQVMTGSTHIVVTPDGERTILGLRGANAATDPRQICEGAFESASLFYLSGYALIAEPQRSAALLAFDMACRHGLTVALDPGMSGSLAEAERLRSQLPRVDLLLPNLIEARELTEELAPGDCARSLVAAGVGLVALKLGREGCLICDGTSDVLVPGFSIKAQDSTGAGDSFAAGLLAAHLSGLDWTAAGVLANAMGALTTGRVGAGGMPTASDLLALLVQTAHVSGGSMERDSVERVIDFVNTLTAQS